MRETERKSKGTSKGASDGQRIRWKPGREKPDQPVDSSVTPDQPYDLSGCPQQPDEPAPMRAH
jgi:hypothetical protein